VAALLLLTGITGCRASPSASSAAHIAFSGDPEPMDAIACNALLSESEVQATLGRDVIPLGRSASSCSWTGGGTTVQLVFGTGEGVVHWRAQVLATFTERVRATGAEVWAESDGTSVAGFGPSRGLLVHGAASREAALALLFLALPRL
jgi:hypothetical protein